MNIEGIQSGEARFVEDTHRLIFYLGNLQILQGIPTIVAPITNSAETLEVIDSRTRAIILREQIDNDLQLTAKDKVAMWDTYYHRIKGVFTIAQIGNTTTLTLENRLLDKNLGKGAVGITIGMLDNLAELPNTLDGYEPILAQTAFDRPVIYGDIPGYPYITIA